MTKDIKTQQQTGQIEKSGLFIPTGPSSYDKGGVQQEALNIPTMVPAPQKGQEPMLDLKLYNPPKKPNPMMDKQANLPIEPIALSTPFIPPQFQNYLNTFMKQYTTPFIYKDYNIQIGGPNANHMFASMVYEDALPSSEIFSSYKSLKERNSLLDYTRSTFITVSDGEFIDWKGGPMSLNSRLKLIELTPYRSNKYNGSNPYTNAEPGLLLYKSCYPIFYDKNNGMAQCQKNSVGMNVRLYNLSVEEFLCKFPDKITKLNKNKVNQKLFNKLKEIGSKEIDSKEINVDFTRDCEQYDVWRELKYYEFIRTSINKLLISPNFVQSYCFFLNADANMNFHKNSKIENPLISENLGKNDSNITLTILTESPNQNIYDWSSNIYSLDSNIRKQIYSGYKTAEKWQTVIFQMLISFIVMEKNKFTFNDMKVPNNFFIKDVNVYGDSGIQYWVYNVLGIDYYVPCKGDVLLIDSDYHAVSKSDDFKIIGEIFGDSDEIIKKTIRTNAIACLNADNFTTPNFTSNGGVSPPESIIKLLQDINKSLRDENNTLQTVLQDNFLNYLHNRVGTNIREGEKAYIKKQDVRPFKKGELIIYENAYETYQIIIYIESVDDLKCKCITKPQKTTGSGLPITNNIEIVELSKDMLYHYAESEIIKQDTLPGQPSISLDYIIETYVI